MKNIFRFLGFVAFVAGIVFTMTACDNRHDYARWPRELENTRWNNPNVASGHGSYIHFQSWGRVGVTLRVGVSIPDYELISVNGRTLTVRGYGQNNENIGTFILCTDFNIIDFHTLRLTGGDSMFSNLMNVDLIRIEN